MHAVITMKHWSHHLHNGMLAMWHHIDEHLRSRHFWAGVGVTLLLVGLLTLMFIVAKNAPIEPPSIEYSYPFGIPYGPVR